MIKAEIVADSLSPNGDRLVSVLCTFPRIILAEVNTHRQLSKNTASSRAIPFAKMVESVKTNPFIPIAWQKEHKGMQGSEYFDFSSGDATQNEIVSGWLSARDAAVTLASYLNGKGVTKQLCNRLLEPFMWTTMLITGSLEQGWDNFFNLRCPNYEVHIEDYGIQSFKSKRKVIDAIHESQIETFNSYSTVQWLKLNKGAAEIHMMALAECIYDAFNESTPKQLKAGEWHIPFDNEIVKLISDVNSKDFDMDLDYSMTRVKISTSMAARTFYTIVGEEKQTSIKDQFLLHNRLVAQNPPHSSPMEHCARVMDNNEYYTNIKGELPINKNWFETIDVYSEYPRVLGWCRNFKGFIPYRHIIETNGN